MRFRTVRAPGEVGVPTEAGAREVELAQLGRGEGADLHGRWTLSGGWMGSCPTAARCLRGGACVSWPGEAGGLRPVDLERVGGWVVIPRWPEFARGRLRPARTGGSWSSRRRIDLERSSSAEPICGGKVLSPRRLSRRLSGGTVGAELNRRGKVTGRRAVGLVRARSTAGNRRCGFTRYEPRGKAAVRAEAGARAGAIASAMRGDAGHPGGGSILCAAVR